MWSFAEKEYVFYSYLKDYPDFPIWQVPLAKFSDKPIWKVPLAKFINEDKPSIELLLCRTKSDTKARFALRRITLPRGIAQYETEKLFADVASALPQIEGLKDDDN